MPATKAAPRSDPAVRFTLSGAAETLVHDGNWRIDCPEGFASLVVAPRRRVGGVQIGPVVMAREHAEGLAAYLDSVTEVVACLTPEERGPYGEIRTAREAAARIRAALSEADQGPCRR